MSKENPMLQTEPRTFADMAVAQDWELEQGNEGALIWADLGPELARVVCENPEILAELAVLLSMGEVLSTEAWAGARKGAWTEVGMWYGTSLCPGARAWVKDRYL